MATAYSLNAWIAGYTALLDEIVTGSGSAAVAVFDANNVMLAEATIDSATSAVNGATGNLSLAIDMQEDAAPASGTASYAQIVNANGEPTIQVPCQQGVDPVAGYCVINTLAITAGSPVAFLSIDIPAGAVLE